MKYLILVSLLIVGCGAKQQSTEAPSVIKDTFYFTPTNPNGKRVFLIHGMGSTHLSLLKEEPYATLTKEIVNQGYELVLFDNKVYSTDYYRDGGLVYRDQFLEMMGSIIDQSDDHFGHKSFNVVMGISYGGLHAMVAAKYMDRVNAFGALIPVVKISALNAEIYQVDNSQFSNETDLNLYGNKPGLMAWSNDDLWVDYRLSESLFQSLSLVDPNVSSIVFDHCSHSISQDVSPILNWLNSL